MHSGNPCTRYHKSDQLMSARHKTEAETKDLKKILAEKGSVGNCEYFEGIVIVRARQSFYVTRTLQFESTQIKMK